ncbi:MAG: Type 1 glutamine amidotransferase-like domain-containing protein [Planctomycetes bacterium]|nr:Type 1 glutamine amidotransferase-like domain-containing protein [Planctomycetota bacterium]
MTSRSPRLGRSASSWALILCLTSACVCPAGEKWQDPTRRWTTIGPPNGTLLIHGGSHGGRGADAFLSLIADMDAPIVVIPTAGADDRCGPDAPGAIVLRERGARNVAVLHTRERTVADSQEFVAPLRKARGVWISGGLQSRLAKAYLHTRTHAELLAVLERGGIVAGNSAGASIQGSFLYGGHAAGDIGFGFVRDSAIGQHYVRRRRMGGLQRIVGQHPELLGIGLDEGAFIIVRGDAFEVQGDAKVAICDGGGPERADDRSYVLLYPGDSYDMKGRRILSAKTWDPEDQWEGAEREWEDPAGAWRTLGPPKGSLLMTGDRPSPAMAARFLERAGGAGARIVVVPNWNGKESGRRCEELDLLAAAGAENTVLWHTLDRRAANSVEFVAPLARADAIWICAGEQWKLADAYRHTLAQREFSRLLERGGVLAASGGGARFIAERMAGDPYGWDLGCGFLRRAVVHTWPGGGRRMDEIEAVLKEHPSSLGIGIDDDAAILVQGDGFEVIGGGKVAVLDATRPGWPWEDPCEAYILLGKGERYDMTARRPDW